MCQSVVVLDHDTAHPPHQLTQLPVSRTPTKSLLGHSEDTQGTQRAHSIEGTALVTHAYHDSLTLPREISTRTISICPTPKSLQSWINRFSECK